MCCLFVYIKFIYSYAEWSEYCKNFTYIFDSLSYSIMDSMNIAMVDIDKDIPLRKLFNVNGVPTILFIHNDDYYFYNDELKMKEIKIFVTEGYKNAKPIKGTRFLKFSYIILFYSDKLEGYYHILDHFLNETFEYYKEQGYSLYYIIYYSLFQLGVVFLIIFVVVFSFAFCLFTAPRKLMHIKSE